jgi:DNA-binding MarR family transcriptional regulator
MANRSPNLLSPEPPPALMEVVRQRLSGRELETVDAMFALRATAQQVDNAITEWFADSAGSPSRFQILTLLWAAKGFFVPHKDIVAAMGVTKATVSGLMASLERDGLVKSSVDRDDRRKLLAILTTRGEQIITKAFETITTRLRTVLEPVPSADLTALMALLHGLREAFAANADAAPAKPRRRRA